MGTCNTPPANPGSNPLFTFQGKDFRVIAKNGEAIFLGLDVCEILGTRTDNIKGILEPDEYLTRPLHYRGQVRDMLFLTEAGLYSLILRSRKTEAKEFKRWITHEVLPSIRKDGGYVVALESDTAEDIAERAIMSGLSAVKRLQKMVAERDAQIGVLAPKAAVFEEHCGRSMTINQFARTLEGVNLNMVRNDLKRLGYLYHNGLGLRVYSLYRDKYFVEKINTHDQGDRAMYVTPQGKELMTKLYQEGELTLKVVKEKKKKKVSTPPAEVGTGVTYQMGYR